METVTIYGTDNCPYCIKAKNLLEHENIPYKEIRVDVNDAERDIMMKLSGRRTVPQIFVGSHHIGGFDDLHALHQKGGFLPLLAPK